MKKRAGNFIMYGLFLVCLTADLGFLPALQAQTDPFFKGKTIRLIGGSGGFYESWARIIARHMGKHIPGNPNIVVQPMLGAGSLIAANYVYNVAKPDGLTLGMFLNTIYLDQLVGRKEVQFSVEKFGWIGSPVGEAMMLYMRADTPYKSIADIIKAKEPPQVWRHGDRKLQLYTRHAAGGNCRGKVHFGSRLSGLRRHGHGSGEGRSRLPRPQRLRPFRAGAL
jgi:tripartite-type tricarboxylate transporter receptor subunit TctC